MQLAKKNLHKYIYILILDILLKYMNHIIILH